MRTFDESALNEARMKARQLIMIANSEEELISGLREIFTEAYYANFQTGTLSPDERTLIEDEIMRQLNGTDEYEGLYQLAVQFLAGSISGAMLASRAGSYIGSARSLFYDVEIARERIKNIFNYGVRTLAPGVESCIDCLYYSTLPPQILEDVIIPGRACKCYGNCKCRIELVE